MIGFWYTFSALSGASISSECLTMPHLTSDFFADFASYSSGVLTLIFFLLASFRAAASVNRLRKNGFSSQGLCYMLFLLFNSASFGVLSGLLLLDHDFLLLSSRFFLHGLARLVVAASVVAFCLLVHFMVSANATYCSSTSKMKFAVASSTFAAIIFAARMVWTFVYVGSDVNDRELFDVIFGKVGSILTTLDLMGEFFQFTALLLVIFYLRGRDGAPASRGPIISVSFVFATSILANFIANFALVTMLETNTAFRESLKVSEEGISGEITTLVGADLAGFLYLMFTVIPLTFSLVKLWIPPSLDLTRATLNRLETIVLGPGPNILLIFLIGWASIFLAFEGAQRTCAKPLGQGAFFARLGAAALWWLVPVTFCIIRAPFISLLESVAAGPLIPRHNGHLFLAHKICAIGCSFYVAVHIIGHAFLAKHSPPVALLNDDQKTYWRTVATTDFNLVWAWSWLTGVLMTLILIFMLADYYLNKWNIGPGNFRSRHLRCVAAFVVLFAAHGAKQVLSVMYSPYCLVPIIVFAVVPKFFYFKTAFIAQPRYEVFEGHLKDRNDIVVIRMSPEDTLYATETMAETEIEKQDVDIEAGIPLCYRPSGDAGASPAMFSDTTARKNSTESESTPARLLPRNENTAKELAKIINLDKMGWVWLRINNIDPHISKPFTAVLVRASRDTSVSSKSSSAGSIKYLELHISVTSFANDIEARNWTSNLRRIAQGDQKFREKIHNGKSAPLARDFTPLHVQGLFNGRLSQVDVSRRRHIVIWGCNVGITPFFGLLQNIIQRNYSCAVSAFFKVSGNNEYENHVFNLLCECLTPQNSEKANYDIDCKLFSTTDKAARADIISRAGLERMLQISPAPRVAPPPRASDTTPVLTQKDEIACAIEDYVRITRDTKGGLVALLFCGSARTFEMYEDVLQDRPDLRSGVEVFAEFA